jgi:hypothetical protein
MKLNVHMSSAMKVFHEQEAFDCKGQGRAQVVQVLGDRLDIVVVDNFNNWMKYEEGVHHDVLQVTY